jgi:hypothetical protein
VLPVSAPGRHYGCLSPGGGCVDTEKGFLDPGYFNEYVFAPITKAAQGESPKYTAAKLQKAMFASRRSGEDWLRGPATSRIYS